MKDKKRYFLEKLWSIYKDEMKISVKINHFTPELEALRVLDDHITGCELSQDLDDEIEEDLKLRLFLEGNYNDR